MKWSNQEYNTILLSYFAEYKNATGEDRKKVVKKIKKEIEDSAKKNRKIVPDGLSSVRFLLHFQLC
jgi:ribosome recycling factor